MKTRFVRILTLLTMLAGSMIFLETAACANLQIQLSSDGGTTYTTVAFAASGGTASYTNTFGGITFNALSVTSNSPGTPSLAKTLGSTLDAINKTGTVQTVFIKIGDTGFTAPQTPPSITVDSHVGGSVTGTNSANLLTFQSYVDSANGQNSTAGFTTGPQNPAVTSGSFQSDATGTITSLTSTYSITELFKLTLGANGGELNFASNTTLSPVPEPNTMALVGAGLPLLALGYRRIRRGVKD